MARIPATGRIPRRDAQDLIEDVEWMFETGESVYGIAARVGMTVPDLASFYRRRGLKFPFLMDPRTRTYVRRDQYEADNLTESAS